MDDAILAPINDRVRKNATQLKASNIQRCTSKFAWGVSPLCGMFSSSTSDFSSGTDVSINSYTDEKLEIDHLLPRNWRDPERRKVPAAKSDPIIKKTAVALRTNRSIGGRARSEYLQPLRGSAARDKAREGHILESHQIEYDVLLTASREDELIRLIEWPAGRTITRPSSNGTGSAEAQAEKQCTDGAEE
jgi:hypothetical protein